MINPNAIYEQLVQAGDDWSDANAAADLLEETRKTKLAQLQLGFVEEKSMAAKEMNALASSEYESFIKGMVTARKLANRARVKYDSAKIYTDLLRTQSATERIANRFAT